MLIHVQDGKTPLYIASQKGHWAVVKLLLEQHADVSICNTVMWLHRSSMCLYDFAILLQDGWTPLMATALERGEVDVVRLLTAAQALVNIRTKV